MSYSTLQKWGWSNFFFQQLSFEEISQEKTVDSIFRITAIHRNRIEAIGACGESSIICPAEFQPVSQYLAVGDWVMAELTNEHHRLSRILEPKNRIRRISNGLPQVIAANLDYLWIITSANDEFKVKRLERYLALAYEFDITPVIILTKTDVCENLDDYLEQLNHLNIDNIHPLSVNTPHTLNALSAYMGEGVSIAVLGSSGVGKSTLINAFFHTELPTREIREDDARGKHTTTHRELFFCDNGVAIIDTPGMRELQLFDPEQGIERTFHSVVELSQQCRYANCSHAAEPGCAIQTAIADGSISQAHFENYCKLLKEEESQKRRTIGAHAVKEHYRQYFKKIHSGNKDQW
ncbi:MAG: rsgA [Solimicrobium sp.]|jgi:ribosome biogenesis GTPase|nr:rsgA [Solimicrobium sp.]